MHAPCDVQSPWAPCPAACTARADWCRPDQLHSTPPSHACSMHPDEPSPLHRAESTETCIHTHGSWRTLAAACRPLWVSSAASSCSPSPPPAVQHGFVISEGGGLLVQGACRECISDTCSVKASVICRSASGGRLNRSRYCHAQKHEVHGTGVMRGRQEQTKCISRHATLTLFRVASRCCALMTPRCLPLLSSALLCKTGK